MLTYWRQTFIEIVCASARARQFKIPNANTAERDSLRSGKSVYSAFSECIIRGAGDKLSLIFSWKGFIGFHMISRLHAA